jgi:uncharacterized membrane protein YeaQ/YmgE (transglycosylase-associated protein family)
MNTTSLVLILIATGALTGWLAPAVVNSRRPYGLGGDLVASVVTLLVLGLVEWLWILPALRITGTFAVLFAIGDPFAGALVVLWLMRKIKPAQPARRQIPKNEPR